jgi:large subunit ribosomal protein L13
MLNKVKTYSTKATDIKRQWHTIDASGKTLGRLAAQITPLLMGKHKAIFSPNADAGDYVIVINADKVAFTGKKKAKQKLYQSHSGYPGGFKEITLEALMEKHPTRAVQHAIEGMLPHTFLSAKMKKRLRVYSSDTKPDLSQFKDPSVKVEKKAKPAKAAKPAEAKAEAKPAQAEPESK